ERVGIIDPQVMVDRRQKVAGAADPFDGVFSAPVSGADKTTRRNAASRPDVREAARPVVTTRLSCTGGGTRIAGPGAGGIADLRRAAKFARDHHEHTFVEAALINVLDQR